MINLTSNRAKRQALFYIDRQMAVIESRFSKRLYSALSKQYNAVADFIEIGSLDVDHILSQTSVMFFDVYKTYYKIIYNLFGDIIFNAMKDEKSFMSYEQKSLKDNYYKFMESWAKTEMGMKITRLFTSTKRKIAAKIESMLEEGYSNKLIAQEIRGISKALNKTRAATIARTETHTVAMKSTSQAMATTRLKYTKEWVAANDSRTRNAHALADGQTVPKDDWYIVGGEKMFYPGDPAASPENTINCRCVEIYNTIRE